MNETYIDYKRVMSEIETLYYKYAEKHIRTTGDAKEFAFVLTRKAAKALNDVTIYAGNKKIGDPQYTVYGIQFLVLDVAYDETSPVRLLRTVTDDAR